MVTFTYGTLSVQLRNPDFGDKEDIEIRRINRKTRGGDLVMYRDPSWPKFVTYDWKWSFLKQSDLYRMLDFMKRSLGQRITVVDYEGRTLSNAIITTPAEQFSQDGREDYKAALKFQVDL